VPQVDRDQRRLGHIGTLVSTDASRPHAGRGQDTATLAGPVHEQGSAGTQLAAAVGQLHGREREWGDLLRSRRHRNRACDAFTVVLSSPYDQRSVSCPFVELVATILRFAQSALAYPDLLVHDFVERLFCGLGMRELGGNSTNATGGSVAECSDHQRSG
jgi:hypothetical protein